MTVRLSCIELAKIYRTAAKREIRALDSISLEVMEGEFLTIVGASGSGKSTLLRIFARLEQPSSGTFTDHQAIGNERVGFVFQGNSVFPWRTVERNLLYASEARSEIHPHQEVEAARLCQMVGLDPLVFLGKYPRELSGGELRRVAIGMALSAGASLLLFDEATSQLDYLSKIHLQATIQRLWMETRQTVVYVTHDIEEALLLGTRVAVLKSGHVEDILSIDLPTPRNRDLLSESFLCTLRHRVLDDLGVQQ